MKGKTMKNPRMILLPAIILMAGMLACSAISGLVSTPTPALPTQIPSPTADPDAPLLEETEFDRSSCFEGGGTEDVERFTEGGQFHMKINSPDIIAWTVCDNHPFSDFVLEADATHVEGPDANAFGLIFRFNQSTDEFYNFSIGADGYYVLSLDGLNYTEPKFIVEWNTSPAITLGKETNHLKVVAIGDRIEYYVNDQLVGEAIDPNLVSGDVGFFVSSFDEGGVHISFDNLKVSQP
jgi:hypothetical protein